MPLHPTLVLDVVGLTPGLLGESTPNLSALARSGSVSTIAPVTPAVTCTAQATYLTGTLANDHGIVANGWYFRDTAEVAFWKQSNHLVRGEKVWEAAKRRDPSFTCAKLFWWYNMYSTADYSVTPRPMYPADGRKLPDVYSSPASLRDELQAELGQFPLFKFWGPMANIESSQWIAECAKRVQRRFHPSLNLVYLPHLDYNLQRLGPNTPEVHEDLRQIDVVCGELFALAKDEGMRVLVLSEYGITEVSDAVHVNRALREAGWIAVRDELGREVLDAGASRAFAVADHQVAHVYVHDPADVPDVRTLLEGLDGVERVLEGAKRASAGLDHPRSGELIAISAADRWFSYYYWLDDARAPDFARTVDIHRKPGYDPVELFLDPNLAAPKLRVAARLAQRKLGQRALLDVIGLDTSIVRGSHGRPTTDPDEQPIVMSSEPGILGDSPLPAMAVKELILAHVFDST